MEGPREELFSRKTLAPGEQRAYVVAGLMERYRLVVCSAHADPSWRRMGIGLVNQVQEAVDSVHPRSCTWVPNGCGILLLT